MMSQEDTSLQETLADAVLGLPQEFFINDKRYELRSPSLGISILISRHMKGLDINHRNLEENSSLEALRICSQNKDKVCSILSLYTLCGFNEVADSRLRKQRKEDFLKLSEDELSMLFLFILSSVKPETLISLSGIDKEQIRQAEIARYKNKDGHTLSFGGKTLFGMLLDTACSRYGWSKEYVVWGIDLVSLRMMLADSINSVYLTDEEMKALHISSSHNQRVEMTQEAIDKVKQQYDWS